MSDNSSENIQKPQIPYSLLIMGAASRLIGASLRDYHLNPSIAAKSAAVAYRMFGGAGIPTEIDLSVEGADFGQEIIYPENSTDLPPENDTSYNLIKGGNKWPKRDILRNRSSTSSARRRFS